MARQRAVARRRRCVRWNTPDGVVTPRSHMLLRVNLHGHPFIVDVGFGIQTPTTPLRLEPDIEQSTRHERVSLIKAGEGFMLEAEVDRARKSLYWFDAGSRLDALLERGARLPDRHGLSEIQGNGMREVHP